MVKRVLLSALLLLAACDPGPVDPAVQNEVFAAAARPLCPTGYVRKGNKCIKAPSPEPTPTPDPTPTPVPDPTPLPTPEPTPVPEPVPTPPSGDVLSPSLTGLAPIADNFDTEAQKVPYDIPGTAAPDFGAFRFDCNAGQIRRDDPIVYPGQPGKSHLHQFFGNLAADANSTYDSLRTTGESTCMSKLNRSGYWIPTMLDGKGNVVVPDVVGIYYKRWPKTDPHCNTLGGYPTKFNVEGQACVNLPNGLRFIFGFNMLDHSDPPTGSVNYSCLGDYHPGPSLTEALNRCRAIGGKQRIIAKIEAPNCWDGKRLDSADHRSHVAYASYGDWGYMRCPTTHPFVIPTFTMSVNYTIDHTVDDTTLWRFSSDMTGMAPGSTFHGDWFGAWSPQEDWQDNCIDKQLNCAAGNLGNGKGMKNEANVAANRDVAVRLVPVP